MTDRLELTIPNDVHALREAGASVGTFLEREGVGGATVFAASLVLEELVTNVIQYAYEDGDRHDIALEVGVDASDLTLRISDDGRAFDPTRVPEPEKPDSLEDAPIGGRGLALVRRRARELRYERAGERNRVEVRIRRERAGAAGESGR